MAIKTTADAARDDKEPGRVRQWLSKAPAAVIRRVTQERRVVFTPSTVRMAGPLSFTRGGMFCTYVLGGQGWDFQSRDARLALWDSGTYRWASLRGRTVKLRSTPRPYPSYEFARSLDEDTPEPLPTAPGGHSWDDYLGFAQRRLAQTGLDTKMVTLSVWVGPNPSRRVQEELINGTDHPLPETVKATEEVRTVTEYMRGHGFNGVPATPQDQAFMMHRSLSMGVPSPMHAGVAGGRWEPDDVLGFFSRREWIYEPLTGSTVKVVADHNGRTVERYVAVMSLGPMPETHWPENGTDPWMLLGDKLGFPVEWSLSGKMLDAKELVPAITFEQNRAEGIRKHYGEHDMVPPPAVGRAIATARANLDEVEEGDKRHAARFLGPVRVATYADTEAECLDQARKLVTAYGERLNIEIAHPRGQAQMLREFIPGEPWSTIGYQRRIPARYMAAALPNVDAEVGTPTGPYLGYGSGSARRAIRWDGHYGPEVLNKPGLYTITAEPGGGKSVLSGALAFNCARRGEPTIVLDPSGPLARLCQMPELKPYSRHLDLTNAEPGTLASYQLVPEPRRGDYVDERTGDVSELDYSRAVRMAASERQQLMFDVLRMWLPSSTLRQRGTDVQLRTAIRQVHHRVREQGLPDVQANPRWVLEELRKLGEDTADLCSEIEAAAEFPLGELIMPPHSDPIPADKADDKTLVVVTMPGLNPPPADVERDLWASAELYAQPLLHSAAFFCSRFIYGRDRNVRKNAFMDETSMMGQWGSGRALFVRLSTDSRKFDTAVYAASQHPDDHLSIGRLDALQGGAFVGRLTKPETATRACALLSCPPEYARVIQGLSPENMTGEFLIADPEGRINRGRVDIDWYPGLKDVLQTTPGRVRPDVQLQAQPTPFLDPALFVTIPSIPILAEQEAVAA